MPHLLKRLELNGFKSFAGKTVLEFPPGITAIVGPNGSGKSNVVDAIRWLLGERDARNLRGGNVEDLIFAGTPKRPRVGQAHAALHFENQNNFFPVDFAEVVVARQVARDGESRYFLNKAEVLLRDLVDFFAKARLGSRGLVVVTQGKSDVFLTASPEERREMIEEILGLREYQIKKADASRRLKNSRINLDKVKALVDELLPHLRSLKRQTGRWEKRGVLQQELEALERKFFGTRWREVSREISAAEERIAAHETSRRVLEEAKRNAEKREAAVEAGQPKERGELLKVKKELSELYANRGALEKRVGNLEARLEAERRAPGGKENANAEEALKFLHRVKQELHELMHADAEDVQDGIKGLINRIATFLAGERGGDAGREGSVALETELKAVTRELLEFDKTMSGLKEREEALEKGQQEFMGTFKKAVAEVEAARQRVEEWEEAARKLSFEKERHELHLAELKHQIRQAGHAEEAFAKVPAAQLSEGVDMTSAEQRMFRLRGELASIGDVDEALVKEARETEERYEFLKREGKDLENATGDLKNLIAELRERIHGEFAGALVKINEEFNKFFVLMFGGGKAKLKLAARDKKPEAEAGNPEPESGEAKKEVAGENGNGGEDEEPGVEIQLSLPKKRLESLEVLSGGERSLVGIAALFALISVSPPPFLVLDEIDAALDEKNARRFAQMLQEFSRGTQFIIVTHNRATMESANVLYGVTLDEDGTSKVLSLKFADTAKATS